MGVRGREHLGKRIAQARLEAGLTQAQLASISDIERTAVSKIESGRRRVRADELVRLATALHRRSSWFLDEGNADVLDIHRLKQLRGRILEVASRHGATNVRVFGSLVRGEADVHSDVDLLVDMSPDHSLFDRAALVVDFSELLGCAVDVATPQTLRDRIRDRVLHEAVPL